MHGWIMVSAMAMAASAAEPRYRIEVEPSPEPADWTAFHKWRISVRTPHGFAPRLREFKFECRLAVLNRPPSVAPRVTEIGPGRFLVEAVRFDVPGEWEIEARVRDDEGWERATRRIRAGPVDLLTHLQALRPGRGSRFDRYVASLSEGGDPAAGSRLTEAEQAGLRVYSSRAGGCMRCHEALPRRPAVPRGHAAHLDERERADVEAFLEAAAPLE